MVARPAVKDNSFHAFKHGPELLLLTSEEYRRARRRGALKVKAEKDAFIRGLKERRRELEAQHTVDLGAG